MAALDRTVATGDDLLSTSSAHEHVLIQHQVPAQRKLPALYLLDSIVKNVGTPYTIYFSRGLYKTYMDAYASVDHNTRRKMEEMLKTWMEPVPGSLDVRPVFQPETTKPIVNALIQARSSAFQQSSEQARNEQQLLRGRIPLPANNAYRNTPTPPGGRPGPPMAGPYGQQPPPGLNGGPYGGQPHSQPQTYPIHPVSSDVAKDEGQSLMRFHRHTYHRSRYLSPRHRRRRGCHSCHRHRRLLLSQALRPE